MRVINYFLNYILGLTGRALRALLICVCMLLTSYSALAVVDPLEDPAPQSLRAQQGLLLDVTRAGARLITVGERGHILYSDDQGGSWQQAYVPVRVTLTAVDFSTPDQGWAVGHDGVILASGDGGVSWHKQLDGYQANQLIEDELKRLLALSEEQRLELGIGYQAEELAYLQEDAELFSMEGASRPFLDVQFLNDNTGIAVGAYGMILRTEDGGNSWVPRIAGLNNPENFHINTLVQGRDALYMAGEAGSIYRSEDQGLSWTSLNSPYDGPFFGLALSNGQPGQESLVVYGLRGNAYISEDRGDSWFQLKVGSDAAILGATAISDADFALLTSSGELYRYSAAGQLQGRGMTSDQTALSTGLTIAAEQLLLVGVNGMTQLNLPQIEWEAP